jgi:hypothetical protein
MSEREWKTLAGEWTRHEGSGSVKPTDFASMVFDEGSVDMDGRLVRLKKGLVTVYVNEYGTHSIDAPVGPRYYDLAQYMCSLLGKTLADAFQMPVTFICEK